jgi:hypothetical protein
MKSLLIAGLLSMGLAVQAQSTAHAPDGGTRMTLQSIDVLPLTNAPFSAIVNTEWTTILADGSTATIKNKRRIARDSTGRVFQERALFSPDGDTRPIQTRALEYEDPNRHEYYDCIVAQKTCFLSKYPRQAMSEMPAGIGGLQVCGCASRQMPGQSISHVALGQQTIESVDATGSREITTLPAGQFGNTRSEPIVKEFWYSPRLGLNLVTKRFDPRSGSENFVVDHLSLNEPDPKTFEPPADYRVVSQVVVKQGAER